MLAIYNEVLSAEKRIRSHIRETQLDYSTALSRITHANVYLKCENYQYTGSFKTRGALNKLLSLSNTQKEQGVVTASSGNHGAAVAFGLSKLNIKGKVFVPENASSAKVDNIQNYNIPLEFYGRDCMQTELHALAYAIKHNMIYLSPYNDLQVIAGQGTIGLELSYQLKQIDAVFVPIGGGGLIAGIAGFLKFISPQTKIIGCLPQHSPVMAKSIKTGHIVEMKTLHTLSDATAGGIEPGAITFELCQQYVDDYVLVSESEISDAIITLINTQRSLIEGASATALAAMIKSAGRFQGKNVIVILSGANISLDTLKSVLRTNHENS